MSDDSLVEEPYSTLEELARAHGIGTILRAVGRLLRKRRAELRAEGEFDASRVARDVSRACQEHALKLRDADI